VLQALKINVDMLKLIQLGLTFTNAGGCNANSSSRIGTAAAVSLGSVSVAAPPGAQFILKSMHAQTVHGPLAAAAS
jgi:hypothetical protein